MVSTCPQAKAAFMPNPFSGQAWPPSSRLHTADLSGGCVPPLFPCSFGDQSSLTWRSLGEDQKADHLEETTDSLKLDLRNFLRSSIMSPFFPSSKSQPASHLSAHTLSLPPQSPSCIPMSDGYFPSVDSARVLTGQRGTS